MDNNENVSSTFADLMAKTNEILNNKAPVEATLKDAPAEVVSRISEVIEIPVNVEEKSQNTPETPVKQGEIVRPMSYAERLEMQSRAQTQQKPVEAAQTEKTIQVVEIPVEHIELPITEQVTEPTLDSVEESSAIEEVKTAVVTAISDKATEIKEAILEKTEVVEVIEESLPADEAVLSNKEEPYEMTDYYTFVETVGLLVGGFFIALWMFMSTIAVDIFKIIKSFVLFLASKFNDLFVEPIKDAKLELGELKIEYLEAKSGIKDNLKKSPKTFFPTLNTYRKAVYANHPNMFSNTVNTILPIIGFVILVATIGHFGSSTFALEVESSGKTIGYVANETVYTEAQNLVSDRFSTDLSTEKSTTKLDTSYKVVTVEPNELTDSETISDSLVESANAEAVYACGVYIDGEFICALKTETDAMQVFNNIIDTYEKEDETDVVGFVEDVQYVQGLYANNEETIWDSQQLSDLLTKTKSESKYYTVQDGDTLSSIANANDLTVKELLAMNPDAEETIHVGDELLVANEVNYVRLKVVKTEIVTESIAYKTEKTNNSSLYKGTTKVTQKGVKGLDSVTYLVTYVDGVQTSTEEVNRVTLREPTTEKIDVGTKVSTYGSYSGSTYTYNGARLIWPVNGVYTVSSRYGPRWGTVHGGIDISNGIAGYTVVAAASGTVTVAAATYSGYGNYVMIDHGNGMSTLYGHMMSGSICVSVGQYVSGGQPLGKVGATGYATGPHLHFEVRINGTKVNPGPYIGTY